MIGLVLYPDGEIREIDVDLARRDLLVAALDSTDVMTLDVSPRFVLFLDPWATRDVAPVNVYASLVLLGADHNAAPDAIHGPAILFGRTIDEEPDDVPARVVGWFSSIAESLP